MRGYEPIGYTYDATVYCEACCPVDTDSEEVGAIFPDSETDSPSYCDGCGEFIPESLTSHGVAYVLDSLDDWRNAFAKGATRAPGCLDDWASHLDGYGLDRGAALRLRRFQSAAARFASSPLSEVRP